MVMKLQKLTMTARLGGTTHTRRLNFDGLVDTIALTLCLRCIHPLTTALLISTPSRLTSLTSRLFMSMTLTIYRVPQMLRNQRPTPRQGRGLMV